MERDKLKKALIFDCDNTLWAGVLGEDEVFHDSELQQDIVFLAHRGVIIGLCSKNNEADVTNALKDQILSFDIISVYRINWKDKVSNLREIAEELNIGLDAIVFVDDSDFEINLVREQLPEVMAIYPQELMKTVLKWFDLSGDFSKTTQYKENYNRAKAQEQFTDINDYLASLNMVLNIKICDNSKIDRITELTQKTNQFNLTTKRYTEEQVAYSMFSQRVYSLCVSDRFGDSGLTGVCIINGDYIDVFLLSCRVLGRGIEYALLDYVLADLKRIGRRHIYGQYIRSPKNEQTKGFFGSAGFECLNTTGETVTFVQVLDNYKPKSATYFRYE